MLFFGSWQPIEKSSYNYLEPRNPRDFVSRIPYECHDALHFTWVLGINFRSRSNQLSFFLSPSAVFRVLQNALVIRLWVTLSTVSLQLKINPCTL